MPIVIRLNPLPWLLTPGVVLGGWLFDGRGGALRWLLAWLVVVALATAWVVLRRRFGRRASGPGR